MKRDFRERALREAKEDDESTKARILKVAENLFAKKGYKGTTTREIADAADINIAMIHYHWGSKEELWNAVNSNLYDRGFEFLQELTEKYQRVDSKQEVEELITFLFDYLADNPNVSKLGHGPGAEGAEELWTRDMEKLFFKGLWRYMADNTSLDFEPAELPLAVFCCLGAFTIFFYRPDLVELYFKEDPDDLSKKFRKKVASALSTMVERYGQMD